MACGSGEAEMVPDSEAARFWENHHRGRHSPEGQPVNVQLAQLVEPLPPSSALDLGCGAGGDTLWLAERGWRVTSVDISTAALEKVSAGARARRLADYITTERHDLSQSFPMGRFDLVCAMYFHSAFETPRSQIFRQAAEALTTGGRLLIVDHGSTAPWSWNQDPDTYFPTPKEVGNELGLPRNEWTVERAERCHRQARGPGGQSADVVDHVLLVRRQSANRTRQTTDRYLRSVYEPIQSASMSIGRRS